MLSLFGLGWAEKRYQFRDDGTLKLPLGDFMRPYRSTLTIGILTALIGSVVHAEGTDVQAQLVEQGQYWQARANTQRAAEIWQKVLQLNQNQVNALYGMGLVGESGRTG